MLRIALIATAALGGGPETSPEPAHLQKTETPWRREEIDYILGLEETDASKLASLAALGPEAASGLFDALCEGLDPALHSSDSASRLILLAALEQLDRSTVLALLDEASGSHTPGPRRGVLAVVEAFGARGELQLAATAASYTDPESGFDDQLIEPFERTVLSILAGSPAAVGELPRLVRSAPTEVSAALVRSVAEVGGRTALVTLVQLLGKAEDLDATILGHLGRAARNSYQPLEDEYLPPLHAALTSPDPSVVRAGLQAVGQLEDTSAIEACIDLLDSPSESLAETSLWSLKRITGLDLPPTADRWRAWYESDREWLDKESSGVFNMLRGSNPDTQKRAVNLILQHHLDRHRLAREVAVLLGSTHPDVRLLAAVALRRIGSRTVVPALVTSLSDTDPDVADLAWQTLCDWTGQKLPPDSHEWLNLIAQN